MHIVLALWRARITWFWPIWATITVAAAICVARVVGCAASSEHPKSEQSFVSRNRRIVWSRGAVTALTLLGAFLIFYVALTLKWEAFTYSDNSMFTLNTLRGHDISPEISRATGRFYPLGEQEFNLVRHLTATVAGYHALPIIELLILAGVLLLLDDELSVTQRTVLTIVVLATPAIVISFTGLIYEERNVLLCLALLVFFVKRFDETQVTAWAVAAAVCAQIMIYYKETAFLLLLGFALGRLVLRCVRQDQPGFDYRMLRTKQSRLDLCLASQAVLFLLYYITIMFPRMSMQYADQQRLPLQRVFLAYMKVDILAWLFVAFVLARFYFIFRRRVSASPLWDGLALGGAACFASYLGLRMQSAYYMAPVDLIAVLYLGRLAFLSRRNTHSLVGAIGFIVVAIVLLQDVSLSTFRMYERKNVVHEKAEIASAIKMSFHSGTGNPQRIFFPFASPYRVMEFASYLSYLGLPVEGSLAETPASGKVVLVDRASQKDGLCVEYQKFVCHAGAAPEPGDLVVILPDDDASLAELALFRHPGNLLFSFEPRPTIPQWLNPYFRRLHVVSYAFPQKPLPDRWLNASVTTWN
ncbi:MAG: hypothetical protein WBE97_06225 [Candidatus Acidiferrales bacterium]